MPPHRKEVHYFDLNFEKGWEWYLSYFPDEENALKYSAIGEVTPKYLFDPNVPGRIAERIPECRLIAILRNPADRLYSEYGLSVRDYGNSQSFTSFCDSGREPFRRGLYSEQIERFFQRFDAARIKVLVFEELFADPATVMGEVSGFLGVPPATLGQVPRTRINTSHRHRFPGVYRLTRGFGKALRRSGNDRLVEMVKRTGIKKLFEDSHLPPMAPELRKSLLDQYRPDIRQLESILGRDLSVWVN